MPSVPMDDLLYHNDGFSLATIALALCASAAVFYGTVVRTRWGINRNAVTGSRGQTGRFLGKSETA